MMTTGEVSTAHIRITTNSHRDAFAVALADIQGSMTDQAVADLLGWGVSTVKAVRNRTNTLSVELFGSAIVRTNGKFLKAWLAMLGRRDVPLADVRTNDAGKLAIVARSLAVMADLGPDYSDAALAPRLADFEALREVGFELSARARAAKPLRAVA